jgi:hypothetical protein
MAYLIARTAMALAKRAPPKPPIIFPVLALDLGAEEVVAAATNAEVDEAELVVLRGSEVTATELSLVVSGALVKAGVGIEKSEGRNWEVVFATTVAGGVTGNTGGTTGGTGTGTGAGAGTGTGAGAGAGGTGS